MPLCKFKCLQKDPIATTLLTTNFPIKRHQALKNLSKAPLITPLGIIYCPTGSLIKAYLHHTLP